MQCITKRSIVQLVQVRLQVLVVLSVLVLALGGQVPDGQAGWLTYPPPMVRVAPDRPWRRGAAGRTHARHDQADWLWLLETWPIPLVRSVGLWVLWDLSGSVGPAWVRLIPWGLWVCQRAGMFWPGLRRQPEWQGVHWLLGHAQAVVSVGYLSLALGAGLRSEQAHFPLPRLSLPDTGSGLWGIGLGCVVCGREEAWVEAGPTGDGGYQATLCGHFQVSVAGDAPFRKRLLILFLRLLEGPGPQRGGRRTRDGRTPFVAQEKLAAWFNVPQPDLSRWEQYWLAADWANLLSLHTAEVLTRELMARIVAVFAQFPGWGVEKVYDYLQAQGVAVSQRQVRQAAEQSGWSQLRQALEQVYHVTAAGLRPRDGWLTGQLLAQVETLVAKLEAGTGLTPEEHRSVADLRALAAEVGVVAPPPLKAWPWLMQVERVVFGHWEDVTDGTVRCL